MIKFWSNKHTAQTTETSGKTTMWFWSIRYWKCVGSWKPKAYQWWENYARDCCHGCNQLNRNMITWLLGRSLWLIIPIRCCDVLYQTRIHQNKMYTNQYSKKWVFSVEVGVEGGRGRTVNQQSHNNSFFERPRYNPYWFSWKGPRRRCSFIK